MISEIIALICRRRRHGPKPGHRADPYLTSSSGYEASNRTRLCRPPSADQKFISQTPPLPGLIIVGELLAAATVSG